MFNYFKKSFLIFLLGIGTLPSAYAMENRHQNQTSSYLGLIGLIVKVCVLPSVAGGILVPFLYSKMKNYDYTIHDSFHRIMKTANFSPENSQIIERYLAKGHNPNIIIGRGETPLAIATQCGNYNMVTTLLEHGATDIDNIASRILIEKILYTPQKNDNYIILSKLLPTGTVKNFKILDARNPLIEAIRKKDIILINLLLLNKIGINAYDKDKNTPFSKAVEIALETKDAKDLKIIKRLLECKADPNATDGKALILAVENQNFEMVKFLVEECNVNINANPCYKTALSVAANKNNVEIVKYLLEHKADLNNINDNIPLAWAVKNKNLDMIKLLLQYGANVHASFYADINATYKDTPLSIAIENGSEGLTQYLLDFGANPNSGGWLVKKPLTVAIKCQKLSIVKLLLQYGTNVNPHLYEGNSSPLSTAIKFDNLDAIKLLCNAGASLLKMEKSNDGSAFHQTIVEKKSKKCIKTLLIHARFEKLLRINPTTFSILKQKYPQLVYNELDNKNKKSKPFLLISTLALLAPNNVDDDANFTKKMSEDMPIYRTLLLAQVYDRITELKKILQIKNKQNKTALELLQAVHAQNQAYINEITPLLDGTKLDADFNDLVTALTEISNSNTDNLKRFLFHLASKLKPDNLAFLIYTNCAFPKIDIGI